MSFTTPRLNRTAARRQSCRARLGRPKPSQATARDTVDFFSHTAALAEWYRAEFLPSTLGNILVQGLSSETDPLSRAVKTGDLEEIVEWR